VGSIAVDAKRGRQGRIAFKKGVSGILLRLQSGPLQSASVVTELKKACGKRTTPPSEVCGFVFHVFSRKSRKERAITLSCSRLTLPTGGRKYRRKVRKDACDEGEFPRR